MSINDTYSEIVAGMLSTIRSKTLRNLVIIYRTWREYISQKSPLGPLIANVEAPPTNYITDLLKCSRRSAHDYRLAIQLLMGENQFQWLMGELEKKGSTTLHKK